MLRRQRRRKLIQFFPELREALKAARLRRLDFERMDHLRIQATFAPLGLGLERTIHRLRNILQRNVHGTILEPLWPKGKRTASGLTMSSQELLFRNSDLATLPDPFLGRAFKSTISRGTSLGGMCALQC